MFLFCCGKTSNEKSKEQTETVTHEEHQHGDEMQTIELNNGERWKVDANMLVQIRNMESDVSAFVMNEQKDYRTFSEKLQTNIDLLNSSCTITGQSHNELHK